MMRALALRLEGALQSWGGPVAGNDRPTLDLPTKSGVLGLVAGALGILRDDAAQIAELHRAFQIAVRVDHRGEPGRDFHTAEQVPTADGKLRKDPVVSRRGYLFDASFAVLLVARRPDEPWLERALAALRHPAIPPFLGRRACVPSLPVLASRVVLEGDDVHALFDQVALSRAESLTPLARLELYLEEDLALLAEERRAPRRLRDVARPELPRLFDERIVHRTTAAAPRVVGDHDVARTIDAFFGEGERA